MTISTIPVQPTTDAFTQQVEIENIVFDLTFLWNRRDQHWFLTMGRNGVAIINSIKLVITGDLFFSATRIEGLPSGTFKIIDLDGLDRDPDGTIFGDRVLLQYDDA